MISASQYIDKKAKGLVQVVKVGNSFAMAITRFNPEDGTPAQPEVAAIAIDALRQQKADLESEAANIQVLIDDLTALG